MFCGWSVQSTYTIRSLPVEPKLQFDPAFVAGPRRFSPDQLTSFFFPLAEGERIRKEKDEQKRKGPCLSIRDSLKSG